METVLVEKGGITMEVAKSEAWRYTAIGFKIVTPPAPEEPKAEEPVDKTGSAEKAPKKKKAGE